MLDLKKSKLREKLLVYYFSNPEAEHYIRELAQLLEVDHANLSRELDNLENQGIFISHDRGKQKYFKLNKNNPIFKELKSIIFKTIGVEGILRNFFKNLSGVNLALIYGSFAQSKEDSLSDIDLLIVGDIDLEEISGKIDDLEKKLQREINVIIYSPKEFLRKKKTDAFLKGILEKKYIILKGNL